MGASMNQPMKRLASILGVVRTLARSFVLAFVFVAGCEESRFGLSGNYVLETTHPELVSDGVGTLSLPVIRAWVPALCRGTTTRSEELGGVRILWRCGHLATGSQAGSLRFAPWDGFLEAQPDGTFRGNLVVMLGSANEPESYRTVPFTMRPAAD